jgi:phosphoribosylamine--glycine ligase
MKHEGAAVCVVLASRGYPERPATGDYIDGIDRLWPHGIHLYHAGIDKHLGRWVTSGGRVLGVTARGTTLEDAREAAYAAVAEIQFAGMQYRRDIALVSEGAGRKSENDRPTMQEAANVLDSFGVGHEMHLASAHRSPDKVRDIVASAPGRGVQVFIAAAGMANHLAGTVAAHTSLPVIGVPLMGSALGGADALFSTVQMPPGVPVATVAIGSAGAKNAAVLAVQILALGDGGLRTKLQELKERLARGEKL